MTEGSTVGVVVRTIIFYVAGTLSSLGGSPSLVQERTYEHAAIASTMIASTTLRRLDSFSTGPVSSLVASPRSTPTEANTVDRRNFSAVVSSLFR